MPDHIEIDDVTPRIAYTATSGQTIFAIPFAFFADEDLLVYVNDILKTITTDYTVTGSGASEVASRKVTFVTGLTVGDSVVIVRDIPIARTTDFPEAGPFNIRALNTQLDKIFAILQQEEDNITRTLRLADSDPAGNVTLPAKAARASKALAFDASGNVVASASIIGTTVSGFMATVLDDPDGATARATLGITDTSAYVGLSNWHHCR